MLARVKGGSFALLSRTGITGIVGGSDWRRQRLAIIGYHGISLDDEHLWNPSRYVSADTLRRRFEALRVAGCTVLPLTDAIARLSAATLPPRAVALTFDAGFYDFKVRGWPLLRRFEYPATVYLATKGCEHQHPVVRLVLAYVLWTCRHATLDGRGIPGLNRSAYRLETADARQQAIAAIDRDMAGRRLDIGSRQRVVRQVVERLGLDHGRLFDSRVLQLMTESDVAAIAGTTLVDFQLQTRRHQPADDAHLLVSEIREDRERLEAMTGRRPEHLCYPSGVWRQRDLPLLRREGVLSATTCDPGLASRQCDPLLLPRFIDNELVDDATFDAWITGVAGWLPRRRAAAMQAEAA